eukprot:c40193_g1_i1.p1 GENE.c40193_g1_i1~~c40193_g1_i1.p1  ORF type:complete len:527 (+),score=114.62 c40193_g1_i1:111-1691(+)
MRRRQQQQNTRVLGVWSVVALTWFNVSGGCFGAEQVISAGGPLYGLAALLTIFHFFSLPMALMTAELSTAFPKDGGYGLWVNEAFGNFWGFQESFWSWVSGVVDNAVYPVLTYDALVNYFLPAPPAFWPAYAIKCAIVIVFSIPNMFAVKLAGKALIVLMVVVTLPFCLLCILALPRLHLHHLLDHKPLAQVKWSLLLSTTFWSLSGFDCASTFAGEVKTPKSTYPKAMNAALVTVFLTYMVPLPIAVASDSPPWQTWADGDFTKIGQAIGGRSLGFAMAVCAVLASLGQFVAELFEDSFQLMGMAQTGVMPRFLARRSRFGTPLRAILCSVSLILVLMIANFNQILIIDNFLNCLSICLEILACIHLRRTRSDLARPPGRFSLVPLPLFVFPFLIAFGMLVICLCSSKVTAIVNLAVVLLGCGLYLVLRLCGLAHPIAREEMFRGNNNDIDGGSDGDDGEQYHGRDDGRDVLICDRGPNLQQQQQGVRQTQDGTREDDDEGDENQSEEHVGLLSHRTGRVSTRPD